MKTAHATLSNFRQAPRKMRMVANTVRGKKVTDALVNLDFVGYCLSEYSSGYKSERKNK